MIPNAYSGDDVFQKKLTTLDVQMSVYEIKMYLAGILLCPETIPPSFALEEILLQDTESEIVFKDEKDHMEFMNLFTGLWNQIVSYENSSDRYPKLSSEKKDLKSKKDKIEYILMKGDELVHFYIGLDESGASEYVDQCFDLVKAGMGLYMINDRLCDFSYEYEINKKITDQDIDETLIVIKDFHDKWPSIYMKLNKIFSGIRSGKIKLDSEEEMERKMEEFENSSKLS